MIAIADMAVICFPAKTVIKDVSADYSNYCRNHKYKRRIRKDHKLVNGKQKHPKSERHQRTPVVVVFFVAMPEC